MSSVKKNNLFRKVLWFSRRERVDIEYFYDILLPRRTVSHDPRYKSGIFHSEKCGRDIQYESALELNFIKQLEEDKKVAFYWEQPVRIGYWRGRKKRIYTPDFAIYLKSQELVIAEVKDLPGMLDHRVQLKTEALMEFCSTHGFGLLLTDGRNTPNKLLKARINRKLEKEIMSALAMDILRGRECREIMHRCNAVAPELYKVIIRQNLKFRPFPLKLQKGNENLIFRQVFFQNKKYEDIVQERFVSLFKK